MTLTITRRQFAAALGGAATWPIAARGQQPRRIGILMNGVESPNPRSQQWLNAFNQQLRKLGWIEGRNLHIEYRWNNGDAALTRNYAAELSTLAPDVIVSASTNN